MGFCLHPPDRSRAGFLRGLQLQFVPQIEREVGILEVHERPLVLHLREGDLHAGVAEDPPDVPVEPLGDVDGDQLGAVGVGTSGGDTTLFPSTGSPRKKSE